jgi:anti-sigma factor RsiW
MTCDEARVLLHALLDGELDAGNARAVEAHTATCSRCAVDLRQFREMGRAMSGTALQFSAPAALRDRIAAAIPAPAVPAPRIPVPVAGAPSRRLLLKGFAFGSVLSAAAAAGLALVLQRADQEEQTLDEVVSAHLRSLQAGRLTDVPSSDQHTVRPWFNGKLAVAPPVVNLAGQGFTLVGGRLDYIRGKAVAAIVYRRQAHIINLFVAQAADIEPSVVGHRTVQGFNVRRWSGQGLRLIAISDIDARELQTFATEIEAATGAGG